MDWDKTTYRVTRIPKHFNKSDLSKALINALVLKDLSEVEVHSLATDVSSVGPLHTQTATVSFRVPPEALKSGRQPWELFLPCEKSEPQRIFIDTSFNSFTPLSEPPKSTADVIEYGFRQTLLQPFLLII